MTIAHEQEYQLRTGDFDRRAELQPSSVLDLFQDIAGISAEQTPGMTEKEMHERGIFWAVTRIKYEIVKMPALHQRIIAKTWPLAPTAMGFQREYLLSDLDGNVLVKGSSLWIMMDWENRQFVSARDIYDGPMDFSDEKNFAKVKRLKDFEVQEEPVRMRPAYTDIDVNGHTNNTKYANFALNAWVPGANDHIKTFQIDYRKEVRFGQDIDVFVKREDGTVLVKGSDAESERMFSCLIELA
ncbi:MAG: thioesterase [Coriobacteriales bacterium]|nr:thioesterase [Coriobacteriales bacterium]